MPAPTPSQPRPSQPQGFTLADAYYTLFRHWRLIACSALLGVVAAGGVYVTRRPPYTSEAKLLVRFVLDKRNVNPAEAGAQVSSPVMGGENIMNSEVQICESFDLALRVATNLGPDRILGQSKGGTNVFAAATVIRKGTTIEVPRNSNIMRILFAHPDRDLVQPVLRELVDAYLNKHVEIHRNPGVMDDFLRRQRDELRLSLSQTEAELNQIRTNLGIVSLEDSKHAVMEQITRISDELITVEAQLAEASAAVGELPARPILTNSPSSSTNEAAIPASTIEDYRSLRAEIDSLRRTNRVQLMKFTPEHPLVKGTQALLDEKNRERRKLEAQFPALAQMPVPGATAAALGQDTALGTARDGLSDTTRVAMLRARVHALSEHLAKAQKTATELMSVENRFTELQRTKDLQETNFRYYQATLDQAAVDETLGPGKVTNISSVQSPSVPLKDTKAVKKAFLAALFGPLVLGLALAFGLDMFLDRSVKRPFEVESKLHIPLFVSIPDYPRLNGKTDRRLLTAGQPMGQAPGPRSAGSTDTQVLPSALPTDSRLQPFLETLRDRLVTFFEVHKLNHKPKLVAVTGCHKDTGASTVATGLAASLSETGDGNVLLVDMNAEGGAAHHFSHGRPTLGLLDALEQDKRSQAQVQDNLFVVSELDGQGKLPHVLPKRFLQLVPRLKLSDYDYVIFDMPQMSQTSITPRVARHLDLVLLVAEAEKTNGDLLQQAAKILTDTGANVGVVLNRVRSHVPQRFSHELR